MTPDSWPNHPQVLLLRALLLEKQRAVVSWRQWRSLCAFDAIDTGSQRLIPHLYYRLKAFSVDDSEMTRYASLFKAVWYKNHLIYHELEDALELLDDHGIESVLLKGVPLSVNYYPSPTCRPMNDYDILVDYRDATRALSTLFEGGWRSKWGWTHEILSQRDLSVESSHGLSKTGIFECDLHWHVGPEFGTAEATADFLARRTRIRIGARTSSTLAPEDHLVHAIVHGLQWHPVAQLRWIVDAAMILLKTGSQFDWDRILELAVNYRVMLPLRHGLRYLRENMELPVPARVVERLDRLRPSSLELREYRARLTPGHSAYRGMLIHYANYTRYSSPPHKRRSWAGFVRYLQAKWSLGSPVHVPLRILGRAFRGSVTP